MAHVALLCLCHMSSMHLQLNIIIFRVPLLFERSLWVPGAYAAGGASRKEPLFSENMSPQLVACAFTMAHVRALRLSA